MPLLVNRNGGGIPTRAGKGAERASELVPLGNMETGSAGTCRMLKPEKLPGQEGGITCRGG